MYGILHQGLVLGRIASSGIDHAVVMACKVLEAAVDLCLVLAGFCHGGLQVVRHDGLGYAPVKMQGVIAATDQVLALLAPASFHIGVLAIGQYRHEYLYRNYFPRILVHNMQFLARIVDEHLFPGLVLQFHGTLYLGVLTSVMLHELGIPIGLLCPLGIFVIMMKKGEAGMVARLVHALEIAHQPIVPIIIDRGTGSEKYLQTGIIKSEQLLKGMIAPLEQTHIRIYRVTGDAQGGAYTTVAVTVQM